jgi:hypothetical protein
MIDVVNQAITSGNNYYLHIFESRYSRGTIALLVFEQEFAVEVEESFSGGDSDNSYIGGLLQLAYYPCAAGDSVLDAIAKLNQKLQGITPTENTPPFLAWLTYVGKVNERIGHDMEFETVARQQEKMLEEKLKEAHAS